ncbi:MAG: hypothetical protein GX936_10255 [Clostridiales bacterium]|nr:hypothetical protein [Clostridiales bacterium]
MMSAKSTVGGNVQSNDIGVNIIVNDPAQHIPSKINIAGEITAPEYISIWDTSLGYEDYNGITPSGYRIYEVITDGSSGSYTLGTVYVKVEGEIPVVPTAPQDLTATPGDGQVALSWTAPSSDGGSAITKYQVSKDNGANWTDVGLNTTYTFTGLTNGMAYTFKVRAVNSAGNGAEASTSATPEAVHVSTHTINFYSSGSLYASKTVTGGSALGTNWPDDPTRSGYSFGGWFTGQNGMGTQYMSDTIITSDVDLYAKWTYSDSGRQTVQTPVYQANVRAEDGMEKVLPVTVGGDTGSVFTEEDPWNTRPKGRIVITMPSIPGVGTYSVGIPVPNLSTSDVMGWLTVDTKAGSITVPSNMLTGVSGISGSKAVIAIGQGDKDNLPDTVKAAIGDRPLVQLALSIDGKQTDWSNSNAPVTVSIPYTPTAKELANPENIVVWYIDSSGKVVPVPNGRYDPATRTVTFTTTLFSNYAVAYNPVAFNDVAADAWYHKAVSFVAAREISNGTGNGNYSPELKLTRGEFIVLMLRAYGIVPDTSPADNFSDAGNTYYTGYLAAAKRLGIAAGVGNNMYAPGKEITRQEMFTLLYNALSVIGQLPQGSSGKTLQDFSDAAEVASWAEEAMSNFVETGTVFGSGGKLIPTGTATRAEIAQVLYNLLSK